METLLPTLRQLANPTKFVLTTRQSLYAEADVHHFAVPELSAEHALQLVRQEARLRNLPNIAAADNAELRPIVKIVGGNPLALRLLVGQLHAHTLESVLDDLRAARSQTADNLYTYLYRRAWDSLDEISRRALLVMPTTLPCGGTLAQLRKYSKLDEGQLHDALTELVRLNLGGRSR